MRVESSAWMGVTNPRQRRTWVASNANWYKPGFVGIRRPRQVGGRLGGELVEAGRAADVPGHPCIAGGSGRGKRPLPPAMHGCPGTSAARPASTSSPPNLPPTWRGLRIPTKPGLYQFALLATHVRRCRGFVTPIQALDSTRIYNAINPHNVGHPESRFQGLGISGDGRR